MNLFAVCPKCELPIIGKLVNPVICPYCTAPVDPRDVTYDYYFAFLDEIKNNSYFEWDDIQRLLHACDLLLEINNGTCVELAKTMKELESTKSRLKFYLKANELREI